MPDGMSNFFDGATRSAARAMSEAPVTTFADVAANTSGNTRHVRDHVTGAIRTQHWNRERQEWAWEEPAPTDASVAPLAEMEQKARDRVIAQLAVADNKLSGTVTQMLRPDMMQHDFWIAFNLNGHEYRHLVKGPSHAALMIGDEDEWLRQLRDAVAQAVANDLLCSAPEIQRMLGS